MNVRLRRRRTRMLTILAIIVAMTAGLVVGLSDPAWLSVHGGIIWIVVALIKPFELASRALYRRTKALPVRAFFRKTKKDLTEGPP